MLSFVQFYARKLLLSIVVLKFIFNYRVFSTKIYAHEMFESREFRTIFRVAPKCICGPLWRSQCCIVVSQWYRRACACPCTYSLSPRKILDRQQGSASAWLGREPVVMTDLAQPYFQLLRIPSTVEPLTWQGSSSCAKPIVEAISNF